MRYVLDDFLCPFCRYLDRNIIGLCILSNWKCKGNIGWRNSNMLLAHFLQRIIYISCEGLSKLSLISWDLSHRSSINWLHPYFDPSRLLCSPVISNIWLQRSHLDSLFGLKLYTSSHSDCHSLQNRSKLSRRYLVMNGGTNCLRTYWSHFRVNIVLCI